MKTHTRTLMCIAILLYSTGSSLANLGKSSEKEILRLMRLGHNAYDKKDYTSAEERYKEAMDESKKAMSKSSKESGDYLLLGGLASHAVTWLVRTYSHERKFDEAEALCFARIRHLRIAKEPSQRLLETFCSLGYLQADEGKFKEARESFLTAQSIGKKRELDGFYQTEPIAGLGLLEAQSGNFAKAAQMYEKSLSMIGSNNFDFSDRAYMLQCLDTIYQKLGEGSSKLEGVYKNTIANYEYNDRRDQMGIARTFCGYGRLLSKENRFSEAESQYKKAFDIFQRYNDKSGVAQECRSEYSSVLRKLNRAHDAEEIENAR